MTNIHRNVWPSISPISANNEVAKATSEILPDELGDEGREERYREPVHDCHGPPEAHAEVRAPRVARRPNLPTKAEIEDVIRSTSTIGVGVSTVLQAKRELLNT